MKEQLDTARMILPQKVSDYFEIIDLRASDKDWHIFLNEKAIPPDGFNKCTSKGFTDERVVQDFPLRGKPAFLHIRRRKWLNVETNEIITSHFDITQLGTQIYNKTKDKRIALIKLQSGMIK